MDEWINILGQKFQEILGLIQAWWLLAGAFAGSCWFTIKKIWPCVKGLWDANEKIRNLENEKRHLELRHQLLLTKEDLHSTKRNNCTLNEEKQRLIEQLTIKENVVWKDGILYYDNVEICSRCYDTSPSVDRKTVRLLISDHEITGSFYCPECKIHPRTKEGAVQERRKHLNAIRQISGKSY